MYDYNGGADVNYPDETNDTTNEDVEISDAYLKKELFFQEISKLSWYVLHTSVIIISYLNLAGRYYIHL
jgi:hypothetical protein